MLNYQDIAKIVREAANAELPLKSFEDVFAEPFVDSEGNDALRITIVLMPNVAMKLTGDAVLDNLVEIQRRLHQAGEERFPLIEYATREELEEVDDS